ncbi:Holliday junction resolvase RuvX [Polynucleobacter sp. MWH-CaK5]|uniref:Holliday junction resolvase RuvX n=1 Tax=Polynucleobacter sp. MWH-CaK5 TaxID=2689107 RepID=UPI001BFD62E9|nr:Holliday junction resolvase RuvX [Polynucleobacter sp. MWH-CaK5]QWD89143.1 Holliday junction resolvase RuvX [Polynucleobacter sp. MWH-CaK5]
MTKTILAFDFGEKRIGVAVGNTITKTAEALKIIQEKNQDEKFKAIEALIQEWQPELLVVGLPTHPDGAEHEVTLKAKRFGNQLHGRFQKEVVWVDERYTSVSVQDGNDALAAQLILQQYLDTL